MSERRRALVIDFVARGATPDEWKLVLVEEGPWTNTVDELKRLQERLYDTIDSALDGQVAERFPESHGKRITIQLDGYNLPSAEFADFFERFSAGALNSPGYREALNNNPFVKDISFEVNFQSVG